MTYRSTGPGIFTRSLEEYDAAFSLSDDGDPCTPQLLSSLVSATQAHVAATVMLAEITASAANVDHYDLDAWRQAIPPEAPWTTVTFEVDGDTVRDGEEGETWEAQYRVPQHVADDPQLTEEMAEQYSFPRHVRLTRKPKPKHELLPVGTRVLVSDPHGANCGCGNEQPWVGIVRGYDMHRTKYEIAEERYGSPGEYYNFTRWAFADNRVQRHDEQPAPEPDSALAALLSRFQRKWLCGVTRSGQHNNADCTPDDPHEGWGCGYLWHFPLLTDKGAREIGLITDSTKED
jgi:hypothetical protein